MDPALASDFQTLAEIAITLAGFTGLVGVLQISGRRVLEGPEASLVYTLAIVSGIVVVGAFVPSLLSRLFDSAEDLWAWSFRALFTIHLLGWLSAVPFMRRAGGFLGRVPNPWRSVGRAAAGLGVLACLIEGVVAVGFLRALSEFIYLGVLVSLVLIAFSAFLALLFSRPEGAEG